MAKNLKECRKCLEIKSQEYFGTDNRSKDGKKRFCKSCISEMNKLNFLAKRESKLEQILSWQKDNKEKVKEYKRAYAKRKRKTT
jgi:hypothetical protein